MDVRSLCLGVLSLGDASGYEIKKAFEEGALSHIHAASFGSIYPALGALVDDGLAVMREVEQEKRPDKRVYSITPSGRQALRHALNGEPGADKIRSDFLFGIFFAQELSPDELARRLDQRIDWYRGALEQMRACAADDDSGRPPGPRFTRGLGEAVYNAALDYLEANREHLLEEVAARSRRAAE
jgi:DNA-binding PadR family transcriptional regulator